MGLQVLLVCQQSGHQATNYLPVASAIADVCPNGVTNIPSYYTPARCEQRGNKFLQTSRKYRKYMVFILILGNVSGVAFYWQWERSISARQAHLWEFI